MCPFSRVKRQRVRPAPGAASGAPTTHPKQRGDLLDRRRLMADWAGSGAASRQQQAARAEASSPLADERVSRPAPHTRGRVPERPAQHATAGSVRQPGKVSASG